MEIKHRIVDSIARLSLDANIEIDAQIKQLLKKGLGKEFKWFICTYMCKYVCIYMSACEYVFGQKENQK